MARMSGIDFKQALNIRGAFGRGNPIGLVLHRTEASYTHLLNAWTIGPNNRGTSAHFLVGKEDGQVTQLVDTSTIANHAGRGANDIFLGVEFESIPARPGIRGQDPLVIQDSFTPFQISIGNDIVDWISRTHNIPKVGPPSHVQWRQCRGHWHGVMGHADVSRGGFFHTNHGDTLQFIDFIALSVWPS
jgi:N-acetylmuramoyl-L-alanine amidase-like protein